MIAFSITPPVDCELDLMVLLPPLTPRMPAMRLCAKGTVVRVERKDDRVGLGIAGSFGNLESSERAAFARCEGDCRSPLSHI